MGTVLRDLSLVWLLAHSLILFLMLFESRISFRKTVGISIAFAAVAAPLNILCIYLFGVSTAALLVPVTCVLPSLILFFLLAKHRNLRFLFTFCFADTVTLWIMVLTKLLDVLCGVEGYVVMFVARILLVLVTECLVWKFLRKPYHKLQNRITRGWGIFTVTGILFYVAFLFYAFLPELITADYRTALPLFFLLAILPIMYITISILLLSQIDNAEAKEKNELLQLHMHMAQERIKSNTQFEESARILRHDVRHHMVVLHDYVEKGEQDKALAYIRSVSQAIEQSTPKRYCRNDSLNVVLCFYERIAREHGLGFDATIQLGERTLIPDRDLVVILSNAIENAVNHLISTGTAGAVTVWAREDEGAVLLQVKNPCTQSIRFAEGLPVTGESEEDHGFGIKSMVHLIQQYDGIFSFTQEAGEFIFRCGLSALPNSSTPPPRK